MGIHPTLRPERLRGLLLHCGPYDPPTSERSAGLGGWFVRQIAPAYLGTRDLSDARIDQASIVRHATAAFPPTLLSGGG